MSENYGIALAAQAEGGRRTASASVSPFNVLQYATHCKGNGPVMKVVARAKTPEKLLC